MRNKIFLSTATCSIICCSKPLTNSELKAKADARMKKLEENINNLGNNAVKSTFSTWKSKGPYDMDGNETEGADLVKSINDMDEDDSKATISKNWNCFEQAREAYNKSR